MESIESRATRRAFSQSIGRLQQASSAAVSTVVKLMLDQSSPPSVRLRAADIIMERTSKAIELEDIEARLWSIANAKFQLGRSLAGTRGRIKKAYIEGASAWVNAGLLPRALAIADIKDGDGATQDDARIAIIGAEQADERRSFTWGSYIFPSCPEYTEDSTKRIALLGDFMKDQIDEALKAYDRQWQAYQRAYTWQGQALRPPFQGAIAFKGVPGALQPKVNTRVPGDLKFR